MNDEELELVSAYVDGEVTDEERARVDTDPRLLAAADELRAARDAIAGVPSPDEAARERAIAVAMGAFESSGEAAPEASNVVAMEPRRHRRWGHGLGVAAAALVVVAAGVAVFRQDAEAPTADQARLETAGATTPVMTTAPAPVPTALAAPAAAEPQAEEFAMSSAAAAATDPTTADADAVAAAADTSAGVVEFLDADALQAYAEELDTTPPNLPGELDRCHDSAIALVADAVYVDPEGTRHEVIVVSLDGGGFGALDIATCEVVVRTP